MKTKIISLTSKKDTMRPVPLFNSGSYCLEFLVEQFRAREANLYEKWAYYKSDYWVLFLLKGSRLQLRVKAARKPRSGELTGRKP